MTCHARPIPHLGLAPPDLHSRARDASLDMLRRASQRALAAHASRVGAVAANTSARAYTAERTHGA
jgi:predicted component of type VI protein secretion system